MKTRKATALGRRIKKSLIDKGMTQVELAKIIGTDARYINLIIHGERSGKKYIDKIMILLDIDEDELKSA